MKNSTPESQIGVMASNVLPSNSDIMDYRKSIDAKINNMDKRLNKLDSLEKRSVV